MLKKAIASLTSKSQSEREYFFISPFYKWGGTVTFTAHLLRKLRKDNVSRICEKSEEIGKKRLRLRHKL